MSNGLPGNALETGHDGTAGNKRRQLRCHTRYTVGRKKTSRHPLIRYIAIFHLARNCTIFCWLWWRNFTNRKSTRFGILTRYLHRFTCDKTDMHLVALRQCNRLEMCMGMRFPMGIGIPWESRGNWNKTRNWGWEWEVMGNHLNGNGNFLHSHGNLFPQMFFCCV